MITHETTTTTTTADTTTTTAVTAETTTTVDTGSGGPITTTTDIAAGANAPTTTLPLPITSISTRDMPATGSDSTFGAIRAAFLLIAAGVVAMIVARRRLSHMS